MKKKLIFLIVVLLCFIPSLAAYISYQQTAKAPVDENNAIQITITDKNQKQFVLVKEAEGDEAHNMIKFFTVMMKEAQPIVALPDSLMGETFFIVKMSAAAKDQSYEFYFSIDPTANYFRSSDGTTYKIRETDAAQFIATPYAECLYDHSTLPVLTLSNTYNVLPDVAAWQYKNYTGDYVDSDVSELISVTAEYYEIEGGVNLSFDVQPDHCAVTVTDMSGNELYDGGLDLLSTFRMEETEEVQVKLAATWYEDPARSFCGKLEYSFTSLVTAPAEFYLGLTTVDAGKFTAITALNVTKPENIQFVSSLQPALQPVFYKAENNMAVALLPVSADTPSGVYTLTFTYGGTTQETLLTVRNNGRKTSPYEVSEAVIQATRTTATLEEFENLTKQLMAEGSAERYFAGSFLEGINGWSTIRRGFGRDIYLNNSATATYRNNGVDYETGDGVQVMAANKGKVVYAGYLTYTGHIVVLEHGYGLKTWYYNLGSVLVQEGDVVEKGVAIATTGKTGFTGQTGAHIAMSVGETFVSPYDTWADSEIAGKVIIAKIDE